MHTFAKGLTASDTPPIDVLSVSEDGLPAEQGREVVESIAYPGTRTRPYKVYNQMNKEINSVIKRNYKS